MAGMTYVHRLAFVGIVFAGCLAFPTLTVADGAKFQRADGFQITIRCRERWSCIVLGKPPGGSWGVVEKAASGSESFAKLSEKYQSAGFEKQ